MGARGQKRPQAETKGVTLRYLPHAFAILAVVVALAHFRTQIDSNDEGIAAMGAWRVLRGQVPYRDFFAIETPLSFYVVAPLYAVFGVSFTVGRVVTQLLGIAMVVSVFGLARRLIPSPLFAAVPLAFLCQAGVGIFPFASHHWFADVFCLAALLAAYRALEDRWAAGWWLAGAASALALESLQDQGVLISIGLGIVAAFVPPPGSRGRSVARFGGGALAAGLPLALAVLLRSGWGPAWHDLVWFPLTAYRATPGNAYGFLQPFSELLAQWTTGAWRQAPVFIASATVTSLALIATPIAAPLLILWAWRRRSGSTASEALLLTGAVTFLLTALHRWAPINLQWAAAPPALALGWWLHHEHQASPKSRIVTMAAAAVLLTAFALFGWGRIDQAANDLLWADVHSPAGLTRVAGRATGQQIQEMITTVGQRVPQGEPLLVFGWPNWGFATLHPCPIRWDGFAPPDFPPGAYAHDAIAEVEKEKVEWIVTPVFDPPAEGHPDEWKTYLIGRYRLEWANPTWGLWKRLGS
jgi:dolichyl-phosphate-mannose-protein mannosyltransferase